MNNYEELLEHAKNEGLSVDEDYPLIKGKISGLYIDGNIALSDRLETTAEKACVLAEELGHHHTSVGNIIDMSVIWNRKQERQARFNAYERLSGLFKLVEAYEAGCKNRYEMADHLEVTEEFLQDCIDSYRDKYGVGTRIGEYFVMFIPYLSVGKFVK